MRERLDLPFNASSDRRTVPVGLVIVGAVVIIVSLIALFTLDAILFLVSVLNPVACISIVNTVAQVPFVPHSLGGDMLLVE
jgi:multisubunit Na+/H+ antiporter MnhG subunit